MSRSRLPLFLFAVVVVAGAQPPTARAQPPTTTMLTETLRHAQVVTTGIATCPTLQLTVSRSERSDVATRTFLTALIRNCAGVVEVDQPQIQISNDAFVVDARRGTASLLLVAPVPATLTWQRIDEWRNTVDTTIVSERPESTQTQTSHIDTQSAAVSGVLGAYVLQPQPVHVGSQTTATTVTKTTTFTAK